MSRASKASRDAAPSSSRVIWVVFVLLLLDLLGFTLILPLLPSILDHYASTGVGGAFWLHLSRAPVRLLCRAPRCLCVS